MQEAIVSILSIILPILLGWFVGRKMQNVEVKGKEIDNQLKLNEAKLKSKSDELELMSKNAAYYQQMVDDFAERYNKVLEELKKVNDFSKEQESKIDELMKMVKNQNDIIKSRDIEVQELINELRKYKQLNGKS